MAQAFKAIWELQASPYLFHSSHLHPVSMRLGWARTIMATRNCRGNPELQGPSEMLPPIQCVSLYLLLAQAFRATRELQASPAAPKVTAASEAEVARVLAAKSDLEVMQLSPGTEAAAVKKKYRTLTLALHPDKCKVRSCLLQAATMQSKPGS